jgi:hypothetical protein
MSFSFRCNVNAPRGNANNPRGVRASCRSSSASHPCEVRTFRGAHPAPAASRAVHDPFAPQSSGQGPSQSSSSSSSIMYACSWASDPPEGPPSASGWVPEGQATPNWPATPTNAILVSRSGLHAPQDAESPRWGWSVQSPATTVGNQGRSRR